MSLFYRCDRPHLIQIFGLLVLSWSSPGFVVVNILLRIAYVRDQGSTNQAPFPMVRTWKTWVFVAIDFTRHRIHAIAGLQNKSESKVLEINEVQKNRDNAWVAKVLYINYRSSFPPDTRK